MQNQTTPNVNPPILIDSAPTNVRGTEEVSAAEELQKLIDDYSDPEFTRRLLAHMHEAKNQALKQER
jgi:hypothetical protein